MSDDFNFDGKPTRSRGGGGTAMNMWDMLSILVLIITACLVGYFALIFFNPDSSMNFLRPGSVVNGQQGPTTTPTLIQMQATWTSSPTLEMTPTNTPRPTFTSIPTNTPFSLVPPTKTPKPPTITPTPKAPFTASVSQQDSTLYHPDLACNWAGIGGAVVDAKNTPVIGMVVVLRGSLDGKLIELQTVSGINPEYGPSGFEFVLGNVPIKTDKDLYIQLVDQSNLPLSEKIYVSTSSECTKNLVLVRLKKTR